jgi:hypothetical protein
MLRESLAQSGPRSYHVDRLPKGEGRRIGKRNEVLIEGMVELTYFDEMRRQAMRLIGNQGIRERRLRLR